MEFWVDFSILEKIFFCMGTSATIFLILQIITMLLGFGNNGEVEVDLNGDGDGDITVDTSDAFNLFSLRGVVAFFAIGGWVGFILASVNTILAIACAFVSGTIALFIMAFLMRSLMKLRSDGNIDYRKAVGKVAEVYLTIPKKGMGCGKINLNLEERYVELNAIQMGENPILTGSRVKIIDCQGDTLVVESL